MRFRLLLLVLALVISAVAQRAPRGGVPGGNSGRAGFPGSSNDSSNTADQQSIMIRLTTEQERPFQGMARVELLNNSGISVTETVAQDGRAEIGQIRPGNYRLRVTGPDIEDTSTEAFYVRAFERSLQFVRVRLKPSAQAAGSKQGAVSAHELNVPEKAKSELRKGEEQIAHSEWKKAIEHLNKAIAIYPQYATAYNELGYAYIKTGDNAQAREAFQKSVDLDEHTGLALLNLARFSMADGDYPGTISLVNRSLALGPSNPDALVILANCEYATGNYANALLHARKVHGLAHERQALAHIIAAMALEAQQKPADAALEYETFLKEDPSSPRVAAVRQALARISAQTQPSAAAPKQ